MTEDKVTEDKVTEDKMTEDDWFVQVLDRLAEGIHIVNTEGVTLFYNRAMGRMEGLGPGDVLGKQLLSQFPSLSQETSTLWQVLRTREPVLGVSQTYLNPRGEKITSVNDSYPLFREGLFTGALEVARDLSHEAKLTERVALLQSRLRSSPAGSGDKPYYTFGDIKTQSSLMLKTLAKAEKAARSSVNVLISGETGTGKEMVAQSIHAASPRAGGPFVAQNCAAFPEGLLEGILFGTVRGSFTGALDRPGLFEQTQGGTILLDELDSMGWNLQAKLLRVLQEGKVRRLGDTRERELDVRFLATTNAPAHQSVKEGRLRPDLFYRLSVVDLYLPPLRERGRDVDLLIDYFLALYARLHARNVPRLLPAAAQALKEHDWPGNVRELAHVIEGGLVIAGEEFGLEELPNYLRCGTGRGSAKEAGTAGGDGERGGGAGYLSKVKESDFAGTKEQTSAANGNPGRQVGVSGCEAEERVANGFNFSPEMPSGMSLPERVEWLERRSIQAALAETRGNVTKAAFTLGISRQLLQYKMRRWSLWR
ncbi:RNA polymerase sigma factor 54 interaction domain protein [Acididesulfobacillus acetoxydans]|uniref:Arginine utilization regulatory protein RocR n=1 Tax=Acididesulfobacillus acetoxydans TaxID=1561005 RepID=A0A8S0WWD0_9FIRM|nr:sigma 54-interacting transcriptional regulator [Acididesulfobacillus acetoxydans]CAA7600191.1 RNA polymerase sigma factor 54 interaction domain protein [Acididesulfobacillus acetoxydans]CEJ09569.1 Arginine utilization regulatory protein RocR [Acididesulfobacillus acetoxydans]